MSNPTSPGWFDLGGKERYALTLRLEQADQRAHDAEQHLHNLRQQHRAHRVSAKIQHFHNHALTPAFTAWCRHTLLSRHERILADAAAQRDNLADRVARIKSNAQAKLTELSEANRLLAEALETKAAQLHATEARVKSLESEATQHAAQLQARDDELREAIEVLRRERDTLREAAVGASARLEAQQQRTDAEQSLLSRALASADASAASAKRERDEEVAASSRLAARVEGLEAEAACLRAEASARRLELATEVGGVLAAPAGDTAFGGMAADEVLALHLSSWRRALLQVVFHSWADRLAWRKAAEAERSQHALFVKLPTGAAASTALEGTGETYVDGEREHDSQLVGVVLSSVLKAEAARVEAVWYPRERRARAEAQAVCGSLSLAEAELSALEMERARLAAQLEGEKAAQSALARRLTAAVNALSRGQESADGLSLGLQAARLEALRDLRGEDGAYGDKALEVVADPDPEPMRGADEPGWLAQAAVLVPSGSTEPYVEAADSSCSVDDAPSAALAASQAPPATEPARECVPASGQPSPTSPSLKKKKKNRRK